MKIPIIICLGYIQSVQRQVFNRDWEIQSYDNFKKKNFDSVGYYNFSLPIVKSYYNNFFLEYNNKLRMSIVLPTIDILKAPG